jgi:plasmid stabilization system protein ParE
LALVDRLLDAAEALAELPERGREVPEFPGLGYRELIVGSCRVIYRHDPKTVWVLAVVHGHRLLRDLP